MRAREAEKNHGVLACTACQETKPLSAFVRIKQSREAYYGRCRACRAKKARERYQQNPQERAAQIARAQRSRRKRQAAGNS
jgi:hypothetical protein